MIKKSKDLPDTDSIEQQLDMNESGPLRGDEIEHAHGRRIRVSDHPTLNDDQMESNFNVDMSEEGREGDEESGDGHSSGYQGAEAEFQREPRPGTEDDGMPGEMTETQRKAG